MPARGRRIWVLAAWCLSAFLASVAWVACDKHSGRDGIGKNGSGLSAASISGPGLDGFYVNRAYYEGLRANRSIYGTRLPAGSVYLQVRGDSAELDYNNHEGLTAGVRPLADSASIPRSGQETPIHTVALGRLDDSLYLAWESGFDAPTEFVKLGGNIRTIYDLYGALLLDGAYRCGERALCGDTLVIRGDSLHGLPGGSRSLRLTIDWLDNIPQMDYFVLAHGDTVRHYAYQATREGLALFRIDLPAACKAFEDYDCPLADAKRGAKVMDLRRLGAVAR